MTLVLKSRVASDGAFCISFTNVYFHGNFGHCLGCESCPLGARCLPQLGRFAVRRLPNKLML